MKIIQYIFTLVLWLSSYLNAGSCLSVPKKSATVMPRCSLKSNNESSVAPVQSAASGQLIAQAAAVIVPPKKYKTVLDKQARRQIVEVIPYTEIMEADLKARQEGAKRKKEYATEIKSRLEPHLIAPVAAIVAEYACVQRWKNPVLFNHGQAPIYEFDKEVINNLEKLYPSRAKFVETTSGNGFLLRGDALWQICWQNSAGHTVSMQKVQIAPEWRAHMNNGGFTDMIQLPDRSIGLLSRGSLYKLNQNNGLEYCAQVPLENELKSRDEIRTSDSQWLSKDTLISCCVQKYNWIDPDKQFFHLWHFASNGAVQVSQLQWDAAGINGDAIGDTVGLSGSRIVMKEHRQPYRECVIKVDQENNVMRLIRSSPNRLRSKAYYRRIIKELSNGLIAIGNKDGLIEFLDPGDLRTPTSYAYTVDHYTQEGSNSLEDIVYLEPYETHKLLSVTASGIYMWDLAEAERMHKEMRANLYSNCTRDELESLSGIYFQNVSRAEHSRWGREIFDKACKQVVSFKNLFSAQSRLYAYGFNATRLADGSIIAYGLHEVSDSPADAKARVIAQIRILTPSLELEEEPPASQIAKASHIQ